MYVSVLDQGWLLCYSSVFISLLSFCLLGLSEEEMLKYSPIIVALPVSSCNLDYLTDALGQSAVFDSL